MHDYPRIEIPYTKLSNAIYAALHMQPPRGYYARVDGGPLFTVYLAA